MAVKAVEMVRKIRDKHYEETKHLSVEEQIKIIKQEAEEFQKQLKKRQLPKAGKTASSDRAQNK